MPYIDSFIAAVPTANRDAYVAHVKTAWAIFQRLGAVSMWEGWGDDIPEGEVTSLPMAVKAGADETVVLSWMVWPDKATRDTAWEALMNDPEFGDAMGEMPFDGKRLIHGGFVPIFESEAEGAT